MSQTGRVVSFPSPSRDVRSGIAAALVVGCALLLGALALSGCATQEVDGARTPPATPRGIQPDTLALTADNFADTNGNRYRDTTSVIVYLFGGNHPIPLATDGAFTFTLQSTGGERIAEWHFDQERTAAALREFGPGPAYLFDLSLLEVDAGIGTDHISETEAELSATFQLAAPARSRDSAAPRIIRRRGTPLQIGPVGRTGQ